MSIVKHSQFHLRAVVIQMDKSPRVAFFMQQPNDEIEIALAILQRIAAWLGRFDLDVQRLYPGEGGIGFLVFFYDLLDDVRHAQVLEHAGGPTMAQ
ncbi:Uncharacterised protein [Chromobacterium violaceum]|uniref:Uncharacterized protein n=1 Tax=Chromobacterium violaceum TaxID=536 RepID=A0A447TCW6_CHRVL|nr:Uncharacterised protein [Chromobacterium violaceum]